MTIISPEILTRRDLPGLCAARGLLGVAVEIGTCTGDYADEFLSRWPGRMLICVDPYGPYGLDPYDREADRLSAIARLSRHGIRCRMIREPDTDDLADRIVRCPGRPDLVFVDGDHDYEACGRDLKIWWRRLTPQGILAGHDYCEKLPGVIQAVDEFVAAHGLTLYLSHDLEYQTWYVYRDRATEPFRKCRSWEAVHGR